MPSDEAEGVSGKAETFRHEIREGDVSLILEIRNMGRVSDELRGKIAEAMWNYGYLRFSECLQELAVEYVPVAKARV
jgi:hypothetical protein